MKNTFKILSIILIIIIGFTFISCSPNNEQKVTEEMSSDLYTCGMHPNVVQERPGTCPICGMYLTPMKNSSGDETIDGLVKIDPITVQNIGLRTVKAEIRDLRKKIRTIGRIDYDESQIGFVQTKYSGWVDKIHVNETGQYVNKGDILLEVYSPQLVSAQDEYLEIFQLLQNANLNNQSSKIELLEAQLLSSKNRLANFDISSQQIKNIEQNNEIDRTVKVISQFSGIIDLKHVQEGMAVKPGMKLYSIKNTDKIWVYADIYDFDSQIVKKGNKARMKLSYVPGKKYNGKIEYIYPYVDSKTRTLKVRLEFQNNNNLLMPGMFANVDIFTDPKNNALSVATEAIIFSGDRKLVFKSLGDGKFVPQEVEIGIESHDNYYEIINGLSEGDIIVSSSQFLLDSESKLQESISNMMTNSELNDHSIHNH